MAYVHRRVVAGQTVEHRKMQSYRVHTKGVKRGPNKGTTTEKQAKINERVAEEHLRWDINANFKHKDLHAVLHYSFLDKPTTLRQILDDKAEFLKILRKLCRKHKVKPKVLVVIETKSMTNPHLHVIILTNGRVCFIFGVRRFGPPHPWPLPSQQFEDCRDYQAGHRTSENVSR